MINAAEAIVVKDGWVEDPDMEGIAVDLVRSNL